MTNKAVTLKREPLTDYQIRILAEGAVPDAFDGDVEFALMSMAQELIVLRRIVVLAKNSEHMHDEWAHHQTERAKRSAMEATDELRWELENGKC